MTPAELLLAAADRIDQARADTTPGPWRYEWDESSLSYVLVMGDSSNHVIDTHGADAAWIALLNPDTGGHIADLLRETASSHEAICPSDSCQVPPAALALARAIVGGDA